MKWIVLTKDHPARLHALLESAKAYTPHLRPDVLIEYNDKDTNYMDAYRLLIARLNFREWSSFRADWNHTLQDIVSYPKTNGTSEQLVMFTTDTIVFQSRFNAIEAWSDLKDPSVLGVSLCLAPPPFAFLGGLGHHRFWTWPGCGSQYGEAFQFGTVYRTSDILGPLFRTKWDSPETLRRAVSDDTALRRRAKMACCQEPVLADYPIEDKTATERYLTGEVIDITKLPADHYTWKKYRAVA